MSSIWDGIPADLHPAKEDVGILLAILQKVIEARAMYRDFDYARSMRKGERRLPHSWESDFVRANGWLNRFLIVAMSPPSEWNEQMTNLAKHARLLAQGIKSPKLKELLLKDANFLKDKNGAKLKKIDFLFFTHIESGDLARLSRPNKLDDWFVPGRPTGLFASYAMSARADQAAVLAMPTGLGTPAAAG